MHVTFIYLLHDNYNVREWIEKETTDGFLILKSTFKGKPQPNHITVSDLLFLHGSGTLS